jgi:hypothetical protein
VLRVLQVLVLTVLRVVVLQVRRRHVRPAGTSSRKYL